MCTKTVDKNCLKYRKRRIRVAIFGKFRIIKPSHENVTANNTGNVFEYNPVRTGNQILGGWKDMKRKVLSVMLATAMTATLFAGCGEQMKVEQALKQQEQR